MTRLEHLQARAEFVKDLQRVLDVHSDLPLVSIREDAQLVLLERERARGIEANEQVEERDVLHVGAAEFEAPQ